jgi:hypothetical protein
VSARPPGRSLASAILAAALLAFPEGARGREEGDPPAPPAPVPAPAADGKPAEKPPPPPLDAGLPTEKEILREARSDPRNLKPDAFPVHRGPS